MPTPSSSKAPGIAFGSRRRVNLTRKNGVNRPPVNIAHLIKLRRRAENEKVSRIARRQSQKRSRSRSPPPSASLSPVKKSMPEIGGESLKSIVQMNPEAFKGFLNDITKEEEDRILLFLTSLIVRGGEDRTTAIPLGQVLLLPREEFDAFVATLTPKDRMTYALVFEKVDIISRRRR